MSGRRPVEIFADTILTLCWIALVLLIWGDVVQQDEAPIRKENTHETQ